MSTYTEVAFGFAGKPAKGKGAGGEVNWSDPPKVDGHIPFVDIRTKFAYINKLDSAEGQSTDPFFPFVLETCRYWTDPRLIGYSKAALPPSLWGPLLKMQNSLAGMEMVRDDFRLESTETGRCKIVYKFEGAFEWHSDLQPFPFDFGTVVVVMETDNDWLSFDESLMGGAAARTYALREICEPGEGDPGVMHNLLWDGQVPEWTLYGVSHELMLDPPDAAGNERSLEEHVLPLQGADTAVADRDAWAGGVAMDVDQYVDRIGHTATMFLASFAMLFVVGDSLPKTDFLTAIDQVVLGSTVTLGCTAILALCATCWWKRTWETWPSARSRARTGHRKSQSTCQSGVLVLCAGVVLLAAGHAWEVASPRRPEVVQHGDHQPDVHRIVLANPGERRRAHRGRQDPCGLKALSDATAGHSARYVVSQASATRGRSCMSFWQTPPEEEREMNRVEAEDQIGARRRVLRLDLATDGDGCHKAQVMQPQVPIAIPLEVVVLDFSDPL
eukprot:CAMPEP_0206301892 /NCGR_PEP_ID=MMETSP0106_2-20121207/8445_1 /ASSEMBLY_ACC=CAM_ASM_000206 /TAXON_ID=81532 /ORGANISM="Acanthoeca-like sp., Strain 10tr" /LENGTH=499 /DNA_ID=CAMNT_0053732649 /DNA_START=10 /DNA_END=1508 /DNA_ORIENTATION=+